MPAHAHTHILPDGHPSPNPLDAFTVVISSGVTSSGLILNSIEQESVLSGGVALSNTVSSGGLVTVQSGGLTSLDSVLSGGVEVLSVGGIASGVVVSAGGLISGGGQIVGGAIYGFAAGLQVAAGDSLDLNSYIESGGVASALTVVRNTVLDIESGGSATVTSVDDNSFLVTLNGGLDSGSVISNGGGLYLQGVSEGARLLSGGYAFVDAPDSTTSAVLSNAVVSSGGFIEVASGGVASGTKFSHGAVGQVDSLGMMVSTTISGSVTVGFGGMITAPKILGGGSLALSRAGAAVSARISSGSISVAPFAELIGLSVSAGGVLIDNGLVEGNAVGATFLAGQLSGSGSLIQIDNNVMILNGTGSAFTGEVVLASGSVEVASAHSLGAASVYFDQAIALGTALTLQIDAAAQPASGAAFAATLRNFDSVNDRIDLAGLAFVAGATATATGSVLTVKDGAYTTSFKLSEAKATKYTVITDGLGGIQIKATATAGVIGLVHAAAGFTMSSEAPGVVSAHTLQSAHVVLAGEGAGGSVRHLQA